MEAIGPLGAAIMRVLLAIEFAPAVLRRCGSQSVLRVGVGVAGQHFVRGDAGGRLPLTYVGIALLSQALWVLVPLPIVLAIIDRGVITREERYLERKFGQEYLDYKRRVRRWV